MIWDLLAIIGAWTVIVMVLGIVISVFMHRLVNRPPIPKTYDRWREKP